MDVIRIEGKGPLLNTRERFYVHCLSTQKLPMNDNYTDIHNPLFDLIIKNICHITKNTHQPTSLTTTQGSLLNPCSPSPTSPDHNHS
jgi:hypothetical protein